ncbi:MAG: ferrous iron transport protein B [Clostridiales bacterium]|nr:ferrous iron transport protein B [Clostridiales bacterium]
MVIALIGNQNCGKTTLFNRLTGARQHVGNFPGVTVDAKTGPMKAFPECSVVDLPGIYSLRPYSGEELLTRHFLLQEKPDGIINIADAANIERNLYLTLQVLEMGIPTVLALNMMDEVTGNGGKIDIKGMSDLLGVPVVPISAAKNEGIDLLAKTVFETARQKQAPRTIQYDAKPIDQCKREIMSLVRSSLKDETLPLSFCVTKLIEQDEEIVDSLKLSAQELTQMEETVARMERQYGLDRHAALAENRYAFIERVCAKTVKKAKQSKEKQRSIWLDRILMNRVLALPLFFLIILTVFWLTFSVIGPLGQEGMEKGIAFVSESIDRALTAAHVHPVLQSLCMDGIFSGVGSVLSFLPIILVLFFFLSLLEDSGYMTRIAFVMDKPMRKIGLSGKSIVPLLIGFGCTVPAVMSTRTLPSERDRKMTILLIPYMSCSAKIPIYAMFSAAFFAGGKGLILFEIYLIGVLISLVAAAVLRRTLYKGEAAEFVMELPNYRIPSMKSVLILMWEKAKDFIMKAFTVIFIASIVIWFLQSFDVRMQLVSQTSDSMLAGIGKFLSPLFRPLGFDRWELATALVTGLSAKETVISTLSVLTGGASLTGLFANKLSAFSFLLFTLLYTPCVAAFAAIRREFQSFLKAFMIALSQCLVAYAVAFSFYHIASFIMLFLP